MQSLYVFIDESGDFVFTSKGSKYYVITAIITENPSEAFEEFTALKFALLSKEMFPELSQEYREENISNSFHATEDKKVVRNEVFKIISTMKSIKAHAIVVRKNMTNPRLYPPEKFYTKISSYLISYIQKTYKFSSLCVLFNGSPIKKLRRAMLKGVKKEIARNNINKEYNIYFPNSSTERMFDVADYICWAISRKWTRGEMEEYEIIKQLLGSQELDIFKNHKKVYYEFDLTT